MLEFQNSIKRSVSKLDTRHWNLSFIFPSLSDDVIAKFWRRSFFNDIFRSLGISRRRRYQRGESSVRRLASFSTCPPHRDHVKPGRLDEVLPRHGTTRGRRKKGTRWLRWGRGGGTKSEQRKTPKCRYYAERKTFTEEGWINGVAATGIRLLSFFFLAGFFFSA